MCAFMEPAKSIIARLGGPTKVREITGVGMTAPHSWQHPKSKGGTGGLIPMRHIPALLAYAREQGIELTADEFIPPPTPTGEAA